MTVTSQQQPSKSNIDAIVTEGLESHAVSYPGVATAATTTKKKTLYDKLFEDHVICEIKHEFPLSNEFPYSKEGGNKTGSDIDTDTDKTFLIYIDRHLVHEVTSPQAFEGLATSNRSVRRPDSTLVTADHNIPTTDRSNFKSAKTFIHNNDSRTQVVTLQENVAKFGLRYFGLDNINQGIVHVIGPEQGFTLPGTTLVCGDSHTSTHGAFGSLAFGIGTSEVEHVLATQTLIQKKSKNMNIRVDGSLPIGVTSKDLVLHIIGLIGTAGATGCAIEFSGSCIQGLSMEARMSICNMAIEAGGRAGIIAPDQTTFDYLKGRPMAPVYGSETWNKALAYWRTLYSDEGAAFDKQVVINAADVKPTVTWGTSPEQVSPITGSVPDPNTCPKDKKEGMERALKYMGLVANTPLINIKIDKVFIGSCTNSRIEDLRSAAAVVKGCLQSGLKKAPHVYAMVVPGSGLVKQQAEREGLHKIFIDAGFDWREAGCSMCLGMNPDQLNPEERCASTSNRNFEGRQGPRGRTHLMSPAMAAAAGISGYLCDVRTFKIDASVANLAPSSCSFSSPDSSTIGIGMEINMHKEDVSIINCTKEDCSNGSCDNNDCKNNRNNNNNKNNNNSNHNNRFNNKQFTVVKGIAVPLEMANVDTDMIIPKQFLKTLTKSGLGKSLFYEMRYQSDGKSENKSFVLNQSQYKNAKILIVKENFGCGSSREHAPWALKDYGIQCIIAPSFADIFSNNCSQNGLLPVVLDAKQVNVLIEDSKNGNDITVDLSQLKVVRSNGEEFVFEVDPVVRHRLLNGLDDIGETLLKEELIKKFENLRSSYYPWLDGATTSFVPSVSASQLKRFSSDAAGHGVRVNW